jgi:phosphatidylglycerophosphatase A
MRRAIDSCSTVIATGLGSGYSPFAPGTAGSAVGLALFVPLALVGTAWQLLALGLTFFVGTFAATNLARRLQVKDPGRVVVDEVIGMWATLILVPFTLKTALVGFVLFRAMDVVKPWPARQLEDAPEGWGIMLDDLAAGVYANLALRVVLLVWPA